MPDRIPLPEVQQRVVSRSETIDEAASLRALTALDSGGELEVWSANRRVGWISAAYGACSAGGSYPTVTWFHC